MKWPLLTTVILAFLPGIGVAQTSPAPNVTAAVDGIMAAFQNHQLVGIGDAHGTAQEQDFYAALVRDPRFAREVGNVVVEFGDAADQGIMDRYLTGESVPYAELRKVWTDTVGWFPPPFQLGYANFFAQVRTTNLALPPAQRIHVWLGDPPADWNNLKARTDFVTAPNLRNRYPADIIEREILQHGQKAVVIYGTYHLSGDPNLRVFVNGDVSLKTLVEQKHPGAFFIVTPYTGFVEKNCAREFERDKETWPVPALATPVRGSSLDNAVTRRGCPSGPHEPMPPQLDDVQKAQLIESFEEMNTGVAGDALLYLGPAASLTRSPNLPDVYLDDDYRQEVTRHLEIIAPPGVEMRRMGLTPDKNTASPRFLKH